MKVGVRLYLVGSVALLGLFGCGRGWQEAREPWRHDAEVACLKSGAVREGPGIVQMRPITGPGTCGADFPLKVSAFGGGTALGFADDPRPPGGIPRYSPIPVQRAPSPPPAPYAQGPARQPDYDDVPPAQAIRAPAGPMTIHGPGIDSPENEPDFDDPASVAPTVTPSPYGRQPQQAPEPLPPLGPPRPSQVSGGATAVAPAATLACPMVSAVDQWIANSVQPAAQRWFGQPVIEIHQISAYSCRGMNGQRGARISEHAFGNALDVASFTFADGRKVTVQHGWKGQPEERGFLRDVHAAACQQFTTVLGPGSNVFHYNHLHMDLMRHARGRSICNPAPIPGDAVAGRAPFGGRMGFAAERVRSSTPFDAIDNLPAARAGED